MRNYSFFTIIICLFQLNYAMEKVDCLPQQEWRQQFKQLPLQQYNTSVGYNLDLRLWPDERKDVVHTYPSLLAHGFGASPTTMIEYARVDGSHRIPGDAATFCFKDAFTNSGSFILHSSFGQINDIKSFLVALRAMYDCQIKGCNLFGQSRGGGTIPNALAVLNTEIDQWDKGFDTIKSFFQENDRIAIIAMIKKGVVVLDTPMVTSQAGINAHVNKIFGRFSYVAKGVSFLVDRVILPIITRGNYNPSGPQALLSVKDAPSGLTVLVSYQKNDGSVGNAHDEEFVNVLISRFGREKVYIILGNDGDKKFDDIKWAELNDANQKGKIQKRFWIIGLPYRNIPAHNAGFFLLFEKGVLNALFEQYAGSYLNDRTKLNQGLQILSTCPQDVQSEFFDENNYNMHNMDYIENKTNIAIKPKVCFFSRDRFVGFIVVLLNLLMHLKSY